MASTGAEPTGSMGIDIPLACLSERPQLLFNYFKQLFAQVTNPAIDPIREELVMSTITYIGPQGNVLAERPEHAHMVKVPLPVIDNAKAEQLRQLGPAVRFGAQTLDTTFAAADGPGGLCAALDRLCAEAEHAADSGAGVLILSDRGVNEANAPIPSLLACAAVHHHLIRRAKRSKVGIVVEVGRAARGHAFLPADRLRGQCSQPVPGLRHDRRDAGKRHAGEPAALGCAGPRQF